MQNDFIININKALGLNESTDKSVDIVPDAEDKTVCKNASKPDDQQTKYQQIKLDDKFSNGKKGGLTP